MDGTTYVSQQSYLLGLMITYLQNPANWLNGIPLITDFTPGDPAYTLLAAVATAIDTNGLAVFMAKQAATISTAIGTDLDNKAADYGIPRKPALAASGSFTFTKITPSASPIDIPPGTMISTLPDVNGNVITFTTNADATLPAGQTSVNVTATCQIPGSVGNLAANTQLLISSSCPGIDGVSLSVNINNGIDTETDDQLRVKTLNAFAGIARGTSAWYQAIAVSVPGVQSATPAPQNRGPGTIDIFIMGPNNTIPSSAVQAAVQAAIDAQRPDTDDAKVQLPSGLVINATLQIHLITGYDSAATINAVKAALSNFINSLGVGAGVIGYVYASKLISIASNVPGVANATTTFMDTAVSKYQIPQAGTFTVTTI